MRRAFIVFAVGLLLCAIGAVALAILSPACITVRNQSVYGLTKISVTVRGKRKEFPDLAPGEGATRWFLNTGVDSHYSLAAQRSDGVQIQQDNGYVTGGHFYGSVHFAVTSFGEATFTEEYF